jgi:hypothetical protein
VDGLMKLIDKFVATWFFIRSLIAELTQNYGRAVALQNRALAKAQPNSFWVARRISLLCRNGQIGETQPILQELGKAPPSPDPEQEYVRIYAQMWTAFLEGELAKADERFAQLQRINCPKSLVKKWLFSWRRPSVISAESLLSSLDSQGADPLEFLNDESGVHALLGFEAYVEEKYGEGLKHIRNAGKIRRLTAAQRTLEGVLLLHLDRLDEADHILADVAADLSSSTDANEAYLRYFCEIYRPKGSADREAIRARAKALESVAVLSRFFPSGEGEEAHQGFDVEAVLNHFAAARWNYRLHSPGLTPDGSP